MPYKNMYEIKVVGFKTFIFYVTDCNPATDRPRGPPASSITATLSLPTVKRPGHGADHPLSSSSEVANGLEVHLASSLCPHRYLIGLPFTVIHLWNTTKFNLGRAWDGGHIHVYHRHSDTRYYLYPSRQSLGSTQPPTQWLLLVHQEGKSVAA
jgi:hypothetical protein